MIQNVDGEMIFIWYFWVFSMIFQGLGNMVFGAVIYDMPSLNVPFNIFIEKSHSKFLSLPLK